MLWTMHSRRTPTGREAGACSIPASVCKKVAGCSGSAWPGATIYTVRIVLHQQYLESFLNGYILLTLADNEFERGRVGFYDAKGV